MNPVSPDFFRQSLTGMRLILKPYDPVSHLHAIANIYSNPDFADSTGISNSRPVVSALIESKSKRMLRSDTGDWTIFLSNSKEMPIIGEAGIAMWDDEIFVAEIFCAIDPARWGNGFGGESVSILLTHCFAESPILTARIQALRSNVKSIRMAASLGFIESGTRSVQPELSRGFIGGMVSIMDLTLRNFNPFKLEE